MEVTMTIPDDIAAALQNGSAKPLSRRVLELLAVDLYKSGQLSSPQAQAMLGFENRFELDGMLKAHGVFFDYSAEEIAEELETIKTLHAARS